MKHAGKARRAGLKITVFSLIVAVILLVAGWFFTGAILSVLALALGLIALIFSVFSMNFFRDPDPRVPAEPEAILAPGHGTVDVIDETVEKVFMGGRCRRVSIFLSVFDVHVQNAPISGRVAYLKHCHGQFLNAMRKDCADVNENVLIGFESQERSGERVAVRLIAGLLARRIVPWVAEGDALAKGDRISLIQFGSRVDIYLPLDTRVTVNLGSKVKAGETVIARRT